MRYAFYPRGHRDWRRSETTRGCKGTSLLSRWLYCFLPPEPRENGPMMIMDVDFVLIDLNCRKTILLEGKKGKDVITEGQINTYREIDQIYTLGQSAANLEYCGIVFVNHNGDPERPETLCNIRATILRSGAVEGPFNMTQHDLFRLLTMDLTVIDDIKQRDVGKTIAAKVNSRGNSYQPGLY